MLKKEEVFVRVSSEKKARKLKELLEMFGESVYEPTLERLKNGVVSDEYPYVHINRVWTGLSEGITCKENPKVSLKELRNILAFEKLKRGDIIIASIGSTKYVVEFDRFLDTGIILGSKYRTIGHDLILTAGRFKNFIRYATEEEKALLEPKKELEVGKWYKHPKGSIYFINHECERGHLYGYGFDEKGNWDVKHQIDSRYCDFNSVAKYDITEATPKEVEEALIKEAKMWYKVGDVIDQSKIYPNISNKKTIIDIKKFRFGDINKDSVEVLTGICAETVFKNGKWAEVINPEKSLEERIKELEDFVFKATINCICRDEHGKLVAKVDGKALEILSEKTKLR